MSSSDPIVRLNVGGKRFDAAQSTLTRSPFFARMLGGSMGEPTRDVDGRIFVDYEPEGFGSVMRYLRTEACTQKNASFLEKHAFEYFGLNHPGVSTLKRKREDIGSSVRALTGYVGSLLPNLRKRIDEWKPEVAFAEIKADLPSSCESDWGARVLRTMWAPGDGLKIAHEDILDCLVEDLPLDDFEVLDRHLQVGSCGVGSVSASLTLRRK